MISAKISPSINCLTYHWFQEILPEFWVQNTKLITNSVQTGWLKPPHPQHCMNIGVISRIYCIFNTRLPSMWCVVINMQDNTLKEFTQIFLLYRFSFSLCRSFVCFSCQVFNKQFLHCIIYIYYKSDL